MADFATFHSFGLTENQLECTKIVVVKLHPFLSRQELIYKYKHNVVEFSWKMDIFILIKKYYVTTIIFEYPRSEYDLPDSTTYSYTNNEEMLFFYEFLDNFIDHKNQYQYQ
jgi:hypothetical protein